jgi:hypothetical protein
MAGHVPAIALWAITFRILSVIGRNDGEDSRVRQNPNADSSPDASLNAGFGPAPTVGFSVRSPSSTNIFAGVTLPPQSKTGFRGASARPIQSPIPYTDYTKKTLDSGSIPVNPRLFHPSTDKNHDFPMFTGC